MKIKLGTLRKLIREEAENVMVENLSFDEWLNKIEEIFIENDFDFDRPNPSSKEYHSYMNDYKSGKTPSEAFDNMISKLLGAYPLLGLAVNRKSSKSRV